MRLIDADVLEKNLNNAIAIQIGMAKTLGIEDDDGVQMELKAYKDILDGVKEMPTVSEKQKPVKTKDEMPGITVRQLLNLLIDAPNKDGRIEIECRKDVLKDHPFEYGQLKPIEAITTSWGIVIQAVEWNEAKSE